MDSLPKKINLISCEPLVHVSDIKLIRTDTTLDLSQKAEKGMLYLNFGLCLYRPLQKHTCPQWSIWYIKHVCLSLIKVIY
ncbi:hypothetical protein D8674_019792 [Pyrus ussuriensis x Pyrus communis]|uniref:Uncharacterized protein n=1 Tax=Pyrus ussuriensis x Pyrus communis TaxID=2448454 RepID=A0A5N5GE52_9ROSA|nr:hypothetical protein D8674_019792 [Pyrus ussuriensis x Pyrus communis]